MAVKKIVYCRTRFVGFHRWPNAPDSVGYLRDLHRHEFHVEVGVRVQGDDRDVEFITLKQTVDGCIAQQQQYWPAEFSCEMMCNAIYDRLKNMYIIAYIDISEDGENGAQIYYGE